MLILEHLWIIPLLPLLGAAVNGIFAARWPRSAVNAIALGSTGLSFLAALEVVREFLRLNAEQIPWTRSYFTWIEAGSFRANFALQIDQLTLIMLLVVTGVGWLIHLYSVGYMAGRHWLSPIFLVSQPVHVFHADARLGGKLCAAFCGVGRSRALQLPADRLLVLEKDGHGCGQQGLLGKPHRRLRFPAGIIFALPPIWNARLRAHFS